MTQTPATVCICVIISIWPSAFFDNVIKGDLFILMGVCAVQDPGSLENEIMAILSLSSSVEEMQQRLAKIVVATNKSGDAVTTEDLVSMCVHVFVCVCMCVI